MSVDRETFFLPARRLDQEAILRLTREIAASPAAASLGLVPMAVTILNETRQIVFANDRFTTLAGARDFDAIAGQRLGEALGCAHARETGGGCGTTRFCQYCGAARAIVKSLEGQSDTQECAITRAAPVSPLEALNLQVWTSPFSVSGHSLVLNSALDIAHEKALRGYERIFFHDILNAITGIKGLHDIFLLELGDRFADELKLLHGAVQSVRDIIESHKDFLDVEAQEYQTKPSRFDAAALLGKLAGLCQAFNSGHNKALVITPEQPSIFLTADRRIVERIMVNMIKNALEASAPGDTVSIGCECGPTSAPSFWVRNPAVLGAEAKLRVFEKGFSTKGVGRGFGTYSMRLFAETCLGGTIRFTSEPGAGTTFYLELPPG